MSLPPKISEKVKKKSREMFDDKLKNSQLKLNQRKSELGESEKKLRNIEEKWINNQIAFETYSHWHKNLTDQIRALKIQIDMYGDKSKELSELFKSELDKLSHLKLIYLKATTIQKHELIKLVFDNRLYYEEGSYRTHFLTELLQHNTLKINNLYNNFFIKKGENDNVFSLGAPRSSPISSSTESMITCT